MTPVNPVTPVTPPVEPSANKTTSAEPVIEPLSSIQSPQDYASVTGPNELTPGQLGAAIGVPLGVTVLGAGLLVLLLTLRRRRKAKKGNDEHGNDTSMDIDNNSTLMTSLSDADKYSPMPDVNITNKDATTRYIALESLDIERRMQVPYKSLVFLREIGAGSYGKVFQG